MISFNTIRGSVISVGVNGVLVETKIDTPDHYRSFYPLYAINCVTLRLTELGEYHVVIYLPDDAINIGRFAYAYQASALIQAIMQNKADDKDRKG